MVKKVLLILLLILLLLFPINQVKATGLSNVLNGADNFIENGKNREQTINGLALKQLSDTLYNSLLICGTVIAVIVGAVLGVQFIIGSVEQKAKVKDSLVPFLIGCIVIFGAFGIWRLVIILLR